MKIRLCSLSFLAFLSFSGALFAAENFSILYDFTGTPPEDPTTISGSVSGDSAAFTGYTGADFSTSTDTAYVFSNNTPDEMNLGQYLSFTITPSVSGESLYMESFSFSLGGGTTNSQTMTVFANVRAGATTDDFGTLPDLLFTPGDVTTPSHSVPSNTSVSSTFFTADLSDAAYQGVDELSFRIYLYDNRDSTTQITRVIDMSATGTTAIPEPAAFALLTGFGVLFLGLIRRRFLKA